MTDQTQAPDSASTPAAATSFAHPVSLTYEPIGETVEGTAHVKTLTEAEFEALPAGDTPIADGTGLDWSDPDDTLGLADFEAEPVPDRPLARDLPFILSYVDGMVIGWDTCGNCCRHIRICVCIGGPAQPRYVAEWRKKPIVPYAPRVAIVTADPNDVAAKVADVLSTKSGRKQRSDKGKPRGRRKETAATPESVAEAAGDLADAMNKELQ